MNEPDAVLALSALANESRLRLVKALVRAGPDGLPAGQIAQAIDATPSRTSFHLAALTEAGLLSPTRVARNVIYRVDFGAMGALMGYLLHDCCAGDPKVRACC